MFFKNYKIKIIILWQTTCYDIIMSCQCNSSASSHVSNKNLQFFSIYTGSHHINVCSGTSMHIFDVVFVFHVDCRNRAKSHPCYKTQGIQCSSELQMALDLLISFIDLIKLCNVIDMKHMESD